MKNGHSNQENGHTDPPIRLVMADDYVPFREALRGLLKRHADIVIVGEAGCGEDVLSTVYDTNPDVLLLDVELPGLVDGVDIAQHLHSIQSPVKVLILSAYDDKYYIESVLESGVAGYLLKGEPVEVLLRAIRGVARGEQGWFSQEIKGS